jgi:uncharacterized protein (UPF0332 family)
VTWKPFARVLVRKSQRALNVARLALDAGDSDSAVNRSYYAMLNVAQAALLSAGVAEDKLPRTHIGVSEAFRLHAVLPGLMDRQLAGELSRTESHRIRADYTDLEIEPKTATEIVEKAELFVQTVKRVFSLDESSLETKYENHGSDQDGKVSETVATYSNPERTDAHLQPISLEETRRQARENWLRMRQESETGNASGRPYSLEEERRQARENWLRLRQQTIGAGISMGRERGAGQDAKKDLGHAQDNDVDT